ncbi:MAG: SMP-30/gluconolactonase/LRE family protein [Bradymonadaceae bacterium]|nr:SMP-30/gluconolactonase/LRE family protein [Lujinxingiaceae bacterium]
MKRKIRRIVLVAISALVALGVLHTLYLGGMFRTIEPHAPGACVAIEGIVGGEDLEWRANGREIFVSSDDRRNMATTQGAIFLVEPGASNPQPINVTPALDFDFHPHGISLFIDETGKERLFVVNHASHTEHSIELFDVNEDGRLLHVRTITDSALISPNDIAAIDGERFYVTNDHGWRHPLAKTVEDFLQLALGNVLFYDGQGFEEVYGATRYANGINTSLDHRRVYVAETIGRVVHSFARDARTNRLTLEESFDAHTGVDNIDVAADGSLWIAAHPRMLMFLPHSKRGSVRSPSQVIRLEHGEGGALAMKEIYLNNGDPISASATATARDGLMIIGPVFDPFLLVCRLDR